MNENIIDIVSEFYRFLMLLIWVGLVLVRVWYRVDEEDDDD